MEKKIKKDKEEKEQKLNNLLNEHKNEVIIGVILLCIVIICLICLVTSNKDNDDNNNSNDIVQNIPAKNEVDNKENNIETGKDSTTVKEEDLKEAYGMTKDDALNLVKGEFNSDNFTFTVITTNDAKYMVVALNNADKNKYYIEVNPATKEYRFIEI